MGPSFLRVFDRSNSVTRIRMDDAPAVDHALHQQLEYGRDCWLELRTIEGAPCKMLASTIVGTIPSTPETRAASRAVDRAIDREDKGSKRRRRK